MTERGGLKTFSDVILALLIRETRTRFGERYLGLFWVVLEPFFHALPICLIRMLFSQNLEGTFLFLLTGLVPVLYFIKAIGFSLDSIKANINLFSFGPVKPFDVIMARNILELIIFLSSFIFFILIFYLLYGFTPKFKCLFCTFGQVFLLFLFTFTFSLIFSFLSKTYEFLTIPIGYFTKIIYFTSGGFLALGEVPVDFQKYLLYNPVAHLVDFLRAGIIEDHTRSDTSILYPVFWVIFGLAIALLIYRKYREKIFLRQ